LDGADGVGKSEYRMKQFVVASVVLSFCVSRALAADFPAPAQAAPTPPPIYSAIAASKNWGGFYLGINGGYGLGSSQWTLGGVPSGIFNTDGFLFGGALGFNFPISEVVVGLEGDVDWVGFSGSVAGCAVNAGGAVAACETKNNLLSTARARVGYAFDRTLIYVTGGAAFANVQTVLNPPATFDSGMHIGWTAGAGIEFGFAGNWSAKAEYLFVNLGNASCTTAANCGSAAGAGVTVIENMLRAGVNYRFSW